MKRIDTALAVLAAAYTFSAPAALAWQVVGKDTEDEVFRAMKFDAALMWSLGFGAQLVVTCDWPDELSLQLVLHRPYNDYVTPDAEHSTLRIKSPDGQTWEAAAWPYSYTMNDVALISHRKDGIRDLVIRMEGRDQPTTIYFDGINGWRARITVPPFHNDLTTAIDVLDDACKRYAEQS